MHSYHLPHHDNDVRTMHRYHFPRRDKSSMSARARGYLTVAAFHFGIVGGEILLFPSHYTAPSYTAIVQAGYLTAWGASYCIVSAICFTAVIGLWPLFARTGLIAAFVVLLLSAVAVGWGVVEAWADPTRVSASLVVPISLAALAFKDLLMVGQPLRTPTEDQTNARHDQDDTENAEL